MNIIIFTLGNPANIGGVQLSTSRLSDFLVSNGHHTVLYSHFDTPPEQWAYPGEHPVERVAYKQADTAANRLSIRESVMAHNPDIVLIINSSQTAGVVVSALQGTNVPLILSERGAADTVLRYNWACAAQRDLIHSMCTGSHLLMPSYAERFPDFIKAQTHIIPSAVPLPEPHEIEAIKKRKTEILWVGRMTFEKDVEHLVRAFQIIAKDYPKWQLRLIGDGALMDTLQAVAAEDKSSAKRIHFDGAQFGDDLLSAYKNASIFVLPSRSEGCPLALREAMGWALPCIGFADCPGTNEILNDNQNGLLVSGDNRPEALANGLRELIEDEALRTQFGVQASQDARVYNLDTVHAQFMDMFEACIEKGANAPSISDTDKDYHKRLAKMADRVRTIGHTRNWIASKDKRDARAFFKGHVRRQYMQLFGTPVFDFKDYYEQHPEVKLAGTDPLLHFILSDTPNYSPKLLSENSEGPAFNASRLIDFWTAGDFTAIEPERTRLQWERMHKKDVASGVLGRVGIRAFMHFRLRVATWGRQTVWEAVSKRG